MRYRAPQVVQDFKETGLANHFGKKSRGVGGGDEAR